MLASTLRGIVSMRLIPSINGGLVPAVEVLVMTGTIKEYIIDPAQTFKIRDAMEEGDYYGMQTFDQSLLHLYQAGRDHDGRRDGDGEQRARLQDQGAAARRQRRRRRPRAASTRHASATSCAGGQRPDERARCACRRTTTARRDAERGSDRVGHPVGRVGHPARREDLVQLVRHPVG